MNSQQAHLATEPTLHHPACGATGMIKPFGRLFCAVRITFGAVAALTLPFLLTGCSTSFETVPGALSQGTANQGLPIHGRIQGGATPVPGAHVYLFAANTTGYGSASVSLLNAASTGQSDSLGAYAVADSSGQFSIDGDYTCTPNTQVYLYSVGGNPGNGVNPAASFLAVLGTCPTAANFSSTLPSLVVNEVSTVAAAYSLAAYATDATHVSSPNTTLALTGIQNAFVNAANLADTTTGMARATTPAGNGIVPAATIYTLANILGECVNSTGPGSAQCSTLLGTATFDGTPGGTAATETATAALNIAHHPAANVAQLYSVGTGTPIAVAGGLTAMPADFSLSIAFTGGGLNIASPPAIDAQGNVWIADGEGLYGNGGLVELNSLGAPVSPSTGWSDASLSLPDAVVLDTSGNVWVANYTGHNLSEFTSAGAFAATAAAPGNALMYPQYMGIDATGNLWVASSDGSNAGLMKFSGSGAYQATYTGNGLSEPNGLAIDSSGNIWLSQYTGISEFTSAGTPANGSPFRPGASSVANVGLDSTGALWTLDGNGGMNVIRGNQNQFYSVPFSGSTFAVSEALDGAGNDWIVTSTAGSSISSLMEVSGSGAVLSTSAGYSFPSGAYGAGGPAIDGSGNIWVAGGGRVVEFVGIAAPVVTPLAANLRSPYGAPASRP